MIVTLTPNPSTDQTLVLQDVLQRGQVQRLSETSGSAGGKGVNVSHACALAGVETLAIFPAPETDPFMRLIAEANIPHQAVASTGRVRTNITITEPDGTTTKLNGPGPALDALTVATLEGVVAGVASAAQWVVLAGSLPPEVPAGFYSTIVRDLHKHTPYVKTAVDTSDAPLLNLITNLEFAAPYLLKPNAMELGQIVGVDGSELERQAAAGNFAPIATAARTLIRQGVHEVLVTLGPVGAVLVLADAAWHATPPDVAVVSTVGAGDATLAGYVMAQSAGLSHPDAVAQAVAYGAAAASLPGTTIPTPAHLNIAGATVTRLPEHC